MSTPTYVIADTPLASPFRMICSCGRLLNIFITRSRRSRRSTAAPEESNGNKQTTITQKSNVFQLSPMESRTVRVGHVRIHAALLSRGDGCKLLKP